MSEIFQMNAQTWRIEDGFVRFFLLTGDERALLIDSGAMEQQAKEIAQSLTDLPVELLITHADGDHTGSNAEFDTFYMHGAEAANYYKSSRTNDFTPVENGDVLDLGNRPLRIVTLPGHTPGSIAVLDEKYRVLISGDPIQDGAIFMFGTFRNAQAYQHSLLKAKALSECYDEIWPSHGTLPVKPEIIDALYEGMNRVLAGELEPQTVDMHGTQVSRYDVGAAAFLMPCRE